MITKHEWTGDGAFVGTTDRPIDMIKKQNYERWLDFYFGRQSCSQNSRIDKIRNKQQHLIFRVENTTSVIMFEIVNFSVMKYSNELVWLNYDRNEITMSYGIKGKDSSTVSNWCYHFRDYSFYHEFWCSW